MKFSIGQSVWKIDHDIAYDKLSGPYKIIAAGPYAALIEFLETKHYATGDKYAIRELEKVELCCLLSELEADEFDKAQSARYRPGSHVMARVPRAGVGDDWEAGVVIEASHKTVKVLMKGEIITRNLKHVMVMEHLDD
jgi:hypothetical protein